MGWPIYPIILCPVDHLCCRATNLPHSRGRLALLCVSHVCQAGPGISNPGQRRAPQSVDRLTCLFKVAAQAARACSRFQGCAADGGGALPQAARHRRAHVGCGGHAGLGAAAGEEGQAGTAIRQDYSCAAFWRGDAGRWRLLFGPKPPAGGPQKPRQRLPTKHLRAALGQPQRSRLMQWLHFKPGFLRRLSKGLRKRD